MKGSSLGSAMSGALQNLRQIKDRFSFIGVLFVRDTHFVGELYSTYLGGSSSDPHAKRVLI